MNYLTGQKIFLAGIISISAIASISLVDNDTESVSIVSAAVQQKHEKVEEPDDAICLQKQQVKIERAKEELTALENELNDRSNHISLNDAMVSDKILRQQIQAKKDEIESLRTEECSPEPIEMDLIERIKTEKIDKFIAENRDTETTVNNRPSFIIPVDDYVITSNFGYRIHPIYGNEKFHSGVDLGVDYDVPVKASAYGKVVYAGWYSGFGNTVILSHAEGVYTLYGHNNKVLVSEGDIIEQGKVVALAGSTGNSTGPHCHFSMWMDNSLVDPMEYVAR